MLCKSTHCCLYQGVESRMRSHMQAHLQLLQQLKPSAAPAVQQRIASTLDTLQDAAHALNEQQQLQAGTDSTM
jgi:hypothetical protein